MTEEEKELYREEVRQIRREAGRKGGLAKVPKGFAKNRQLASEAGRKGGSTPRVKRGKVG